MISGVVLMSGSPARAASNGTWSVFPSQPGGTPSRLNFDPRLVPGQPYRDQVAVSNLSDNQLSFDLYAADAVDTPDGGFALHRSTDPKVDIGAWTHLETEHVTVPAHARVDIPFVVQVPADARSGDHVGGIVAMSTDVQSSQAGDVQLNRVNAVGVRLYGHVVGQLSPQIAVSNVHITVEKGTLGNVGGQVDVVVRYTISNTGNTVLDPSSVVEVSPLVGSSRRTAPRTLLELLPGEQRVETEDVDGVLPLGLVRAHVTVTADRVTASASARALVLPWLLIAIFLIGIACSIAARLIRRRRTSSPDVRDTTPQLVSP